MRRAAVALLVAGACSQPADLVRDAAFASAGGAIINGDACDAQAFPTAVAVLVDGVVDFAPFGGKQEMKTVVCTGTLVAPDVVLTAAHCVDMSAMTGGFGKVEREGFAVSFEPDLVALAEQRGELPADAIPVTKWIPHPEFSMDAAGSVPSGPGTLHDIAVLLLARSVEGVVPEVVITRDEAAQLQAGSPVDIVGWGMTTVPRSQFEQPPAGSTGRKICARSTINELGAEEMQIGGDSTTSRKCHGDSGGPTFMDVESPHVAKRRLVGITSHAYDERDCKVGGVDTRVDVHLDWVDAELVKGCADGMRSWCEVEGLVPPSFYDPPPPAPVIEPAPLDEGSGGDAMEGGCASVSLAFAPLGLLLARRRRRTR